MNINVNGEPHEVRAQTLAAVLEELGYGGARVATALNGNFVPAGLRSSQNLREGAELEILAPMQGG
ncbi:sulfur carrier protein ThiS [Gluconobacter wancherniae]|uniref:Thiamine biosynthesis protein ThiS n=1 Tax=Gluconobacter wancherniae NBRC 103581 TaxID=656744 RepID=A0A511AYX2_9PROT|nr:sulfur carrier protein ThiS [Gluconobacter wancherniae]MBF0853565.1 sulfur carrier protein ThiS [Gluconobacter wancherniae]MBS1063212.1 sulfur carrier protein ThiS [Gluconobacter wancherniae]MBS1089055.1 sulfur carrier protein ThiS [Gluconobacter wancherniae]MBS1094055.1 sulfur carrier protein ThiS [Gluconobacter wancherniae]GBD55689.1 thiamine biosynthesis protein ThiS [Gluconobacter wancherniae NBRC 103581]